jgi:hypothetical protein
MAEKDLEREKQKDNRLRIREIETIGSRKRQPDSAEMEEKIQ